MVSFSRVDILIIVAFFATIFTVGFYAGRKKNKTSEDYILSGRKVGLFLFVLTNVSTWYGGILGVGEYTYNYGISSWFTQGLPYYFFAFLFAIFFAKKIRKSNLVTIPDKIEQIYGKKAALLTSVLILFLISPAPYILMLSNLITLIFKIKIMWAILISIIATASYLYYSGFAGDLFTDAIEFFVMFAGFILIVFFAYTDYGGIDFLVSNLPSTHLTCTGGASTVYVVVWFLIAIWTFADPGFHQRCNSAKNASIAKKGILISIIFWALFDFFTTTTGLYSKAILPEIKNPVLSFPLLAEKLLAGGWKGLFYAGLFATIISTLNSFMFLSATTFGNDLILRLKPRTSEKGKINAVKTGMVVTGIIAFVISVSFDSVINIWYTVGSICIPGIILLIIGAYFPKWSISPDFALSEIILASLTGFIFWFLKEKSMIPEFYSELEPMFVGLLFALMIHLIGIYKKKKVNFNY